MKTSQDLGNLYFNTADFYDYDNREIIKDDLDFYGYASLTRYLTRYAPPALMKLSLSGVIWANSLIN
jgi:hypothetical protein